MARVSRPGTLACLPVQGPTGTVGSSLTWSRETHCAVLGQAGTQRCSGKRALYSLLTWLQISILLLPSHTSPLHLHFLI